MLLKQRAGIALALAIAGAAQQRRQLDVLQGVERRDQHKLKTKTSELARNASLRLHPSGATVCQHRYFQLLHHRGRRWIRQQVDLPGLPYRQIRAMVCRGLTNQLNSEDGS